MIQKNSRADVLAVVVVIVFVVVTLTVAMGDQPIPPVLSNIPLPPQLEVKTGNLAVNWKRFKRVWDNYEVASRLKLQDKAQRTATLYSCIGVDALEIADGLGIDKEEDIEVVLNKFQSFCIGETNVIYERYCFNKRAQEPNETIDTYVAALNSLAKSCEYAIRHPPR